MSENDRVYAKCAWRIVPLLLGASLLSYIDRVNVSFAALTMNRDLDFSPSVYGFGAGVLFFGYSLCQLPSNLALNRVGARRWISFILASWGAISAACALIHGPVSFFALRFLLGIAEAGLVPGVYLYLTFWFPKAWLCRANAIFACSTVLAGVIGGPMAAVILRLDGIAGIHGWQWLFLLEGLPPVLLAMVIVLLLPDRVQQASWLSVEEKNLITRQIEREDAHKETNLLAALRDRRVLLLGLAHAGLLLGFYGLYFWLPLVIQSMGFSNSAAGFLIGLIYCSALPVMILWARSSDRSGERAWHAAAAALCVSAGFAAAAVSSSNTVVLLALAAASIVGPAWFGPFFSLPPLFLSGPAMAGGIALANAIANLLGGFGGQYFVGLLRQQSGGYSLPFAVIAGVTLMASIIVLLVGRSMAPRTAPAPVAAE
jgi:MFS transporter, ACS family, tartrate transporter